MGKLPESITFDLGTTSVIVPIPPYLNEAENHAYQEGAAVTIRCFIESFGGAIKFEGDPV